MDSKKISFGFSKLSKNTNLFPINKGKEKVETKIELIKCLEGQEIKLVEEKKPEAVIIIPLKENTKTSAALASLIKRRAVLLGEADEPPPEEPVCKEVSTTTIGKSGYANTESLEEMAARELLASVKNDGSEPVDQNLVLPALKADELPLEGAKQSSMDDYESIPIEQFGKAMLRGMGWVEPVQKTGKPTEDEMPFVRPKGMGLGADKALKKQPLLVAPEKNEVLEVKKQAYVRILGGKHKDMYGQIEGFDDHAGRVIVKMAIGGAKEAFNEFLCQPVSRKEFAQYGKCINTAKYEEYKRMENEHGQIVIKKEETDTKLSGYNKKSEYKNEVDDNRKSENNGKDKRDERRIHNWSISKSTQQSKYESARQRCDNQSSSRRRYSINGDREEDARRRDDCKSSNSRRYVLDEQRSSSSRRERYDERRTDEVKLKHTSRGTSRTDYEQQRIPSASGSSRRQQYTDDTSASSGTDSDSDSAYERKHKKKSSHKSKAKKKSGKKSKRKHRHRATDTEISSNSDSEKDEDSKRNRREKKQHKKKTKKSKKPRSRSRSHDRNSRR